MVRLIRCGEGDGDAETSLLGVEDVLVADEEAADHTGEEGGDGEWWRCCAEGCARLCIFV